MSASSRPAPPPYGDLPAGTWRTDVPVLFSHCDPAGIVYFARFFDMANGVIEGWFSAALGLSYADVIGPRRIGLGYAAVAAEFVRPALHGDVLTFAVMVDRIGGASLALSLAAYRAGEPILLLRMTIVTTSLVAHKAIPIPDDLRAALTRYQDACR